MAKDSSSSAKKSQPQPPSIDVFAAQCGNCFKWRVIPTQEEFEDIRSTFIEDPFFCNRKPGVSCDDPTDIERDSTRTWVIDRPNTPKTPEGFQRKLHLRRDYSKFDVTYVTPTGKKVRASTEILQFLKDNPEYKHLSVSDFSFTSPKVMQDTIPQDFERKGSASGSKKIKLTREDV